MSRTRLLSYTEIETALTCWARHDFAYSGHLAGSTLKPRGVAPVFSMGRAWGAGVAAWHAAHGVELFPLLNGHAAIFRSLNQDLKEGQKQGALLPTIGESAEMQDRLSRMLDQYAQTATPLPGLRALEQDLIVPIPALNRSARRSSIYRLLARVDGLWWDGQRWWVVEFKLRGRIQELRMLERGLQNRLYGWAAREHFAPEGIVPAGVIVDQRLNALPELPYTPTGRVSHSRESGASPEEYVRVCEENDVVPKSEVIEALRSKVWQSQHHIPFRDDELDETGRFLPGVARLIRDLDRGAVAPVRNASRLVCNYCKFDPICANPQDHFNVDAQFERTVPKRLREPAPEANNETTEEVAA